MLQIQWSTKFINERLSTNKKKVLELLLSCHDPNKQRELGFCGFKCKKRHKLYKTIQENLLHSQFTKFF